MSVASGSISKQLCLHSSQATSSVHMWKRQERIEGSGIGYKFEIFSIFRFIWPHTNRKTKTKQTSALRASGKVTHSQAKSTLLCHLDCDSVTFSFRSPLWALTNLFEQFWPLCTKQSRIYRLVNQQWISVSLNSLKPSLLADIWSYSHNGDLIQTHGSASCGKVLLLSGFIFFVRLFLNLFCCIMFLFVKVGQSSKSDICGRRLLSPRLLGISQNFSTNATSLQKEVKVKVADSPLKVLLFSPLFSWDPPDPLLLLLLTHLLISSPASPDTPDSPSDFFTRFTWFTWFTWYAWPSPWNSGWTRSAAASNRVASLGSRGAK